MKDFFISYTGADLQWAEWLAVQLRDAGYTTVFQEWDFHAGGNFVLDMHRAAKETYRTLAVLSSRYLDAGFTNPEWAAAFVRDPQGKERLVIPVRIEDFKPEGLFAALIHIDLVGLSESDAKQRLLAKITATIDGGSTQPKAHVVFPGSSSTEKTKGSRYPGALPAVCNLAQRYANFTGRDTILETLYTELQRGHKSAMTRLVIYGLGGIGKTRLALEYVWRYIAAYDLVWWIGAEEISTLVTDYATLASELDLPEKDAAEQQVIIRAVRRWLEHHSGWLLIFDNARDYDAIRNYLPIVSSGQVLITSRNRNWNNNHCSLLKLDVWSREESIAFLHKRNGFSQNSEACNLAKELGDLPLALEQAASFCHNRQKSYAEYLDLFTTRRHELWKREKHPDDYSDTVATTWTLAFEEIEQQPLATEILNLCSMVAPDAIPRLLIIRALACYSVHNSDEPAIDPFQVDDAMELLSTYSLLTLDKEHLSMHRLMQSVAEHRMPAEAKKCFHESLLKALSTEFPDEGYRNPATWPVCAMHLPHAEALVKAIGDENNLSKELSLLLNSIGSYYHVRTAYTEAEPILRRSLAIRERTLGREDPDVATTMNNLALMLRFQGKYAEAEPLHRRSLQINEKVLGSNHPDLALYLDNLAFLLVDQGRYAEAEPLCRRSLEISEKELGPNHANVATSLISLALLLMEQGRYAEAEPLCRRSMEIGEKELGPNHPHVSLSLDNLGELLRREGNFAEAEPLLQRSLGIRKSMLGEEHPAVAMSLNHLALLRKDQGNFADAEPLCRRSLQINEKAFGLNHPKVAKSLVALAGLLELDGRYAEAEILYRRAIAINENMLDLNHPTMLSARNSYEELLRKMQ
jgi:tetratricopeptide (TPR) repeat protein